MKTKNYPFLLMVLLCAFTLTVHAQNIQSTKKVGKVTPGTFSHAFNKTSRSASVGLQEFYSATGRYTISADGIGSLNSSMNIRVNKPNTQATVEKAILISSVTGSTIDNGCVTIDGVPVNWDGTAAVSFFNNYWADVTSIVASTINAFPAGTSTLPITECNTDIIEGEALLVVFNDPSADEKTVVVLVGGEDPQGDNFSVTLAQPIDPNAPGALLDMGLGIGFSYQLNGSDQASEVSVNSQRVSSSAGGEDDGDDANGALLTVGGIGDTNDNPPDPFAPPTNPRSDDELYSILPFITDTTTSLTVSTINPSLDDNIFLAYFVTSGAAVVGEGILLSQTSDTGNVGDNHTVTATLVDDNGNPITDRLVMFTVTAGPNAGNTFSATTDASGNASYTYTGSGGVGTDSIQACFTNSQNETSCSNTLSFTWIQRNQDTCKNVCIVDNFGYIWRLCYTPRDNFNIGTGTVDIGGGLIWNARGWLNCKDGILALHAVNPNADNCASGYVDSFVYRGISFERCNMADVHVGQGNWRSFCSGSVVNRGTFSAVNCRSQVDKVSNPDNVVPAKSAGAVTLMVSPNPMQNSSTITYSLTKESKVSIVVYNYMMQPVKTLVSDTKAAGKYSIVWDGKSSAGSMVGSGLYKIVALINNTPYTITVQVIK